VERFPNSRSLVSSLGLNPSAHSTGGHQRLGPISQQGNPRLRWLLVEAGQSAAQFDAELRRVYQRLQFRRGAKLTKVALARRLAARLYWLLRQASDDATGEARQEASYLSAVGSHVR
jgi:transposase